MMNSADNGNKETPSGIPGGTSPFAKPSTNPFENKNEKSALDATGIPDFLTRKEDNLVAPKPSSTKEPDFLSSPFDKKDTKSSSDFNPFPKSSTSPTTSKKDDDLGFDVDELVKKIDAKIAELEAEEKKEEEKKKAGKTGALSSGIAQSHVPITQTIDSKPKADFLESLSDDLPIKEKSSTDDILFPSQPIKKEEPIKELPTTPVQPPKPTPSSLDLNDDIDDDDFFDDFFDN